MFPDKDFAPVANMKFKKSFALKIKLNFTCGHVDTLGRQSEQTTWPRAH